jgi:hypothetical protein
MINKDHILRQRLESKGKPTLPPLARKMPSLVVLEMKMCKFIHFQVRIIEIEVVQCDQWPG